MARRSRVIEQHLAVFGESGSGKTVLLSSFFGPFQESDHANELWDLVADDAGQGNRLYQNYLGMRDAATVPVATRFASTAYAFSVKIRGGRDAAKRRPFDVLRLVWHDYPGEWFEAEPGSAEEHVRRVDTFRSLLRSDVALLLVDGRRLLDYRGEEQRYLKSMLGNVRQSILRMRDDLLPDGKRLTEFPRIWILAVSKADLLPDWDVDAFRDLVIRTSNDDLDRLRDTLSDLVESPEAFSFGEDFMLLSSASFTLPSDSPEPTVIDTSRRLGLDLILPIVSLLPLERRVQWHDQMKLPWRVVDSMADGAETFAAALTGSKAAVIATGVIMRIGNPKLRKAAATAIPLLAEAAEATGPKLREWAAEARVEHDHLRAMLVGFKSDLERGVEQKILRKKT